MSDFLAAMKMWDGFKGKAMFFDDWSGGERDLKDFVLFREINGEENRKKK